MSPRVAMPLFMVALTLAFGATPILRWTLLLLLPALFVTVWDLVQTRHALRRNYPLIARIRWLFEDMRPYLRAYIVENDREGRPFTIDQRALVYARAKGEISTHPMGTELDVYSDEYEWLGHSIAPNDKAPETWHVRIGGDECAKPYDSALLNISAMSFGSLSANAIEALNKGIEEKTPVIAYGWEPWYYMANADVCRINFPANDWSDPAEASGLTDYPESPLVKLATTKLMDSGSPFAVLVTNFEWTNEDQNQIAADVESGMTPEEAAKKWIDGHPDVVAKWLEGTGAS